MSGRSSCRCNGLTISAVSCVVAQSVVKRILFDQFDCEETQYVNIRLTMSRPSIQYDIVDLVSYTVEKLFRRLQMLPSLFIF